MQSDNVTAKLVRRILLILLAGLPMVSEANQADTLQFFTRTISRKQYELQDHLGNVRAVVSDVKNPLNISNSGEGFKPTLLAATHYDPFGMELPDRNYSSEKYRYGFNGMEKDDEWKGAGNSYNFDARIYDPRIGRWLSVDPLADKFPHQSPYSFAFNNPISFVDPDGKAPKINLTVTGDIKNNSAIMPVLDKLMTSENFLNLLNVAMVRDGLNNTLDISFVDSEGSYASKKRDLKGENFTIFLGGDCKDFHYKNISGLVLEEKPQSFSLNNSSVARIFRKKEYTGFARLLTEKVDPTFVAITLYHEVLHGFLVPGNENHEMMASPYLRDIMKSFAKEFDKLNETSHSEEWYDAMVWTGLGETEAWKNLSEEERGEISVIIMYSRIYEEKRYDLRPGSIKKRFSIKEGVKKLFNSENLTTKPNDQKNK